MSDERNTEYYNSLKQVNLKGIRAVRGWKIKSSQQEIIVKVQFVKLAIKH